MDEIQSTDWFGVKSAENRNTTNMYSNTRDYMLPDVNITSVVEKALEELPEYDFSGPEPSDSPSDSTLDSSLTASGESLDTAAAETGATVYNKKIYLAPLYNGTGSSSAIPQNYKAYETFRKQESFDRDDITAYKQALSRTSYTSKIESDGGIWGASAYKGKSCKIARKSYEEWKLAWNLCLLIGTQLSKDGCDVIYPYSTRSLANASSSPSNLLGGWYSMTLEDIAEDITTKNPDVVLFIGFNEGAFGNVSDPEKVKTTNTQVVYEDFTLINTRSTHNNHLCNMLVKSWQSVGDLNSCLPMYRSIVAKNGENMEAYPGVCKAQTALTALRINDVSAPSCALLLGDFNSNIVAESPAYSYTRLNELGMTIAGIIESSL